MPRKSGNPKHPLTLRLSFQQRSLLLGALQHDRYDGYNDSDKGELADLREQVARLTCQPGGCDYCTDDGPELHYGKED